jgi:mediator of replication checkpoint protein 1
VHTREHLAEDDKALEKLHQDAIEGKFRIKRKHGDVGLSDDSDEDEDDDRARAIRLSMLKKQKMDDATLEALGTIFFKSYRSAHIVDGNSTAKNEETRAFYDTYCQSLGDDNNHEFDHLQHGEADLPDEEEEEEKETIFTHEIRRLVREVAQEQQVCIEFYG